MKYSTISMVFILILSSMGVSAQSEFQDKGNINAHFGTLTAYSTYSLGYESFDFIKSKEKHQIRSVIRVGGWKSSITSKNTGAQSSFGLSYLFGNDTHFLECGSEIVFHFDKGLKGQTIVYIGALYRPFLGYRFQPVNKRIIAKIGVGWKEVVQIGIGYRL